MDEDDWGTERRRHKRYTSSRRVHAGFNGNGRDGTLRDISAGGAGVDIEGWIDEDTDVHLDIEDFGLYPGHVARAMEDFVGVEFDLDEEQEVDLIANILRLRGEGGVSDDEY